MWTHQQLVGDFFTFQDLIDVHELMDIKARNERAVQKFMDPKRN